MESARSQKPGNQSGTFLHLHEWHAGYHEAFLLKYLREQHGAVLESFPYSQAIKNHHRSQSQGHFNDFPYGIVQKSTETSFVYLCCTYCERIPYPNDSFDLIIANHVLFYCKHLTDVFQEIARVLKPNGVFICSTYGSEHMKEINELVSEFDDRIILSAERLFERFGKENGADLLAPYFHNITWLPYEDSLYVTEPETLISYVLSCHGNQNQYIIDHYKEFRNYVRKKTEHGFNITKDAGIFITF